nr:hypothetical protein Iba_chr01bCG17640 [Ipomoea batatas]GME10177.1 hypothetical protein Iba_scaffold9679CG0040 [Ipomoea batatas]
MVTLPLIIDPISLQNTVFSNHEMRQEMAVCWGVTDENLSLVIDEIHDVKGASQSRHPTPSQPCRLKSPGAGSLSLFHVDRYTSCPVTKFFPIPIPVNSIFPESSSLATGFATDLFALVVDHIVVLLSTTRSSTPFFDILSTGDEYDAFLTGFSRFATQQTV